MRHLPSGRRRHAPEPEHQAIIECVDRRLPTGATVPELDDFAEPARPGAAFCDQVICSIDKDAGEIVSWRYCGERGTFTYPTQGPERQVMRCYQHMLSVPELKLLNPKRL